MNLDINTERGQASLEYERKMLDRIRHMMCSKHKNNSALIETDKNMDAKIDGIIIKDNQISGIFESKCRNMSLMDLRNFGSWLVTLDKIMDGKKLSTMLRVPFIGFLYLIKDNIVMYWKITDKFGDFLFDFEVRNTKTQKTINGGTAFRTNAYLPLKHGNEIT
tara:strand:- start:51 stop:539 length:489 start_codon:yes stop_codon:yes gene_type:complete